MTNSMGTNNSVVTLSQVVTIVEEACSTVNSNIVKLSGSGTADLKSYQQTFLSDALIYDENYDMYYVDVTHNLESTNISTSVTDQQGNDYIFTISSKLPNVIRLWLMEQEAIVVNITSF